MVIHLKALYVIPPHSQTLIRSVLLVPINSKYKERMFRSLSFIRGEAQQSKAASGTPCEVSCFFCKIEEAEYKPVPCKCFETCKKCAMKMATGGKCRICKQYFTNMSQCGRAVNVGQKKIRTNIVPSCIIEGISVNDIEILEKKQ